MKEGNEVKSPKTPNWCMFGGGFSCSSIEIHKIYFCFLQTAVVGPSTKSYGRLIKDLQTDLVITRYTNR